jgi:hypothetical protein
VHSAAAELCTLQLRASVPCPLLRRATLQSAMQRIMLRSTCNSSASQCTLPVAAMLCAPTPPTFRWPQSPMTFAPAPPPILRGRAPKVPVQIDDARRGDQRRKQDIAIVGMSAWSAPAVQRKRILRQARCRPSRERGIAAPDAGCQGVVHRGCLEVRCSCERRVAVSAAIGHRSLRRAMSTLSVQL